MNKKKIVFTGIILILVMMFAVTCDTPAAEEVEYTDVVYSPNGSEITLYLDGVGVPVTPAQRAINRELATMAYDFFEVIFIGNPATTVTNQDVARTSWELGQSAGIVNVPRGTKGTGIDYAYDAVKAAADSKSTACMFVGKKSDKTLLGIGFITEVSPKISGLSATSQLTSVDSATTSVKFSIAAIQTGLLAWNKNLSPAGMETIDTTTNLASEVPGVMFSSFKYVDTTPPTGATNYTSMTADNSTRSDINGSPLKYPRYSLPQQDGAFVNAQYEFSHINANAALGGTTAGTNGLFKFAKVISAATDPNDMTGRPLVQKRVPRFMNGGRYMEPKEAWTTTTKVEFYGTGMPASNGNNNGDYTYNATTNANGSLHGQSFVPVVGLRFTSQGSGIFSFYIEIPVYMHSSRPSAFNTGDPVLAQIWKIRTGVGSELYSLDDGIANGGCVFMSVGASAANWLDIDWVWIP